MEELTAAAVIGTETLAVLSDLASDYALRKAADRVESATGLPVTDAFKADVLGNKVEEILDDFLRSLHPNAAPKAQPDTEFLETKMTQLSGRPAQASAIAREAAKAALREESNSIPVRSARAAAHARRAALAASATPSPGSRPLNVKLAKSAARVAQARSSLERHRASIPAAEVPQFLLRPARMTTQADGNVRIHHTEFLGSGEVRTQVSGTGNYYVRGYRINPSDIETFPWLSGIASNFERYELDYVKIHYVPRIGTTTVGSVMMAPDFDVNDPEPATEAELSQMKGAVEFAAFDSATLHMPGSALHSSGPLYTKGSIRAGDARVSDAAIAYIATAGNASANALLGRVYVEYKVRLLDPHDGTHDDNLPAAQICVLQGSSASTAVTTSPIELVFGSLPVGKPYPNFALYAGGFFQIPRGVWEVNFHLEYTAPAAGTVFVDLNQYDGSTWTAVPYCNVGAGKAAISTVGSVTISGVLKQAFNTAHGNVLSAGWLRASIWASTAFTLTELDWTISFRPA